jgi:hypothetical protein
VNHAAHDIASARALEPGWNDSLGSGAPGIALLHIERALAHISSWDAAHGWAAATTHGPVTAHPDTAGLYRGAPAVTFALHGARHHGYAGALATLDHHVATLTRHRLDCAHERINQGLLPTMREFDLISGLTGLGAHLLRRHGDHPLFRDVLTYLVRLTHPIRTPGGTLVPGWWCTDGPTGSPSRHWPGGHGNLGIAHGITGPLALLAISTRRGITVPGQPDAIGRICAWLDRWQHGTQTAPWWPEVISHREWRTDTVRQAGPGRPSWCYGTPGIARAQQLAAIALADPERQRRAEHALTACITDENQLAKLRDPSLCHGWAGLVLTVWRAATDPASGPAIAAHTPGLRARLQHHLQCHGAPDHYGFLEGGSGIQLAQHGSDTNQSPLTRWDACLLIDG